MVNIFINGLNSKTAGGKSILNNYLKLLNKNNGLKYKYYVLTPNKNEYYKFKNTDIEIIDISKISKHKILTIFTYKYIIPNLIKKLKINLIFNLADIPIPTRIKQIFLFDNSYAVYPDSIVWKKRDFFTNCSSKLKWYLLRKYSKCITVMCTQTDLMKKKLEDIYGFKKIIVIPNAVSLDNYINFDKKDFNLPNGKKLLYLTYYYLHKNIEIFIPLAKLFKNKGLDFKIITTIESNQHKNAKIFLDTIKKEKLSDIIINLGAIDMKHVPSLYKQCDGLLMPTLLESFSGTYIEAMYHDIPIFTSDLDFAHSVCSDSAFYFNPLDEKNILEVICTSFNDSELTNKKIKRGKQLLFEMSDWETVFKNIQNLIFDTLKDDKKNE